LTEVKELQRWLSTLESGSSVGVDEGGLTLAEIDDNGKRTEAYLELGGIPESEER